MHEAPPTGCRIALRRKANQCSTARHHSRRSDRVARQMRTSCLPVSAENAGGRVLLGACRLQKRGVVQTVSSRPSRQFLAGGYAELKPQPFQASSNGPSRKVQFSSEPLIRPASRYIAEQDAVVRRRRRSSASTTCVRPL